MSLKSKILDAAIFLNPRLEHLRYRNFSFAQEGEDLIIIELLNFKKNGFFVDVGAHHPFRFSNTYLLSKYGWTGINIEPNPSLHRCFQKYRKNDINLNVGISKTPMSNVKYYEFNEPALNTLSSEVLDQRLREGFQLLNQTEINVVSLKDVFNQHAQGKSIDLLSIDVEGLDFEVLISNDWNLFRPNCVLIEDHDFSFESPSQIHSFLLAEGYLMVARTLRNSIYQIKNKV